MGKSQWVNFRMPKPENKVVAVRTDLTGKLSKHIYTPDLGPKLPS